MQPTRTKAPARPGPRRSLRAGLGPFLGLALLLPCARPAGAEEFIYLGAGPLLGDRARQLRVSPTSGATSGSAPSAGWQSPDLNDSGWAVPGTAPAPAPAAAPADGGAAEHADGGSAPCSGTLYLRRRFDVGPELSRLASLSLRIHYQDGFSAYINGVEVARRRLPEAALTEAGTLATDRSPVEMERYSIPVVKGLLRARDNLLAIEVHPRTPERCARVDAELSAADGARVVRGPYIEKVSENSVDLAVESDVPALVEVRYGKGASRTPSDRRVKDSTPATMHRVRVTGLRAATTYHYQMTLELPGGALTDLPEAAFHTPPRPGRPLRFVVYGDSRSGHDVHAQVVQSVLDEDPDLVLVTGDVVERGTEEGDWDRFFSVAAPLLRQVAVYLVPGNHEYARRGLGAQRLFDLFATVFTPQAQTGELPSARQAVPRDLLAQSGPAGRSLVPEGDRGYYSFDAGGVHFVGLDSNQFRSQRQQRWLEDDLSQASAGAHRARAIIVWSHEGPYSVGWHGDNSEAIRTYVPILERYNVTLFFSGHDHDYERGRRGHLTYVVTGGAGAELRPIRCGVPGKRRCRNQPAIFVNDHNYVRVDVLPGQLKLCAKRIDGTPLEACQTMHLPR